MLGFTPKRAGKEFEKGRSFATIESGKWVGPARAAFDGTVVTFNKSLMNRPTIANEDCYGAGWMLTVLAAATRLASGSGNRERHFPRLRGLDDGREFRGMWHAMRSKADIHTESRADRQRPRSRPSAEGVRHAA